MIINQKVSLMKQYLLTTILFASWGITSTQANTLENNFLQTFAKCDESLLEFIQNNQKPLQKYAQIKSKGNLGQFTLRAVDSETSTVTFRESMDIKGVKVYGMETSHAELDFDEDTKNVLKVYFWQLDLGKQNVSEIAKKWSHLNFKAVTDTDLVGLSQIIPDTQKSLKWQPHTTILMGVAPVINSVEKVLVLTQEDGHTQLMCTVQGYIPQNLINSMKLNLLENN